MLSLEPYCALSLSPSLSPSLPCFPYSYLSSLFYPTFPSLHFPFIPVISLTHLSIFSFSALFITFPPFHPLFTPPYLFSPLFPLLPYFFHPIFLFTLPSPSFSLTFPPSSPSFSLTLCCRLSAGLPYNTTAITYVMYCVWPYRTIDVMNVCNTLRKTFTLRLRLTKYEYVCKSTGQIFKSILFFLWDDKYHVYYPVVEWTRQHTHTHPNTCTALNLNALKWRIVYHTWQECSAVHCRLFRPHHTESSLAHQWHDVTWIK